MHNVPESATCVTVLPEKEQGAMRPDGAGVNRGVAVVDVTLHILPPIPATGLRPTCDTDSSRSGDGCGDHRIPDGSGR